MDAHRLSKCFFSTHVPPRTGGRTEGLSESITSGGLSRLASSQGSQSGSHTNGSGEWRGSQCLERGPYTVRTPSNSHRLPIHCLPPISDDDDPAELEGHLGQQRDSALCARVT